MQSRPRQEGGFAFSVAGLQLRWPGCSPAEASKRMADSPHHKRAQAPLGLRPTFTLKIETKPGAGTNALKFLLKRLARQYGFKCLDAHEEVASALHLSN